MSPTTLVRVAVILVAAAMLATTSVVYAEERLLLRIGYLGQERAQRPALSNIETVPEDAGLAGARLGIDDNTTTGRFTGQDFELIERRLALEEDPAAALTDLTAQGIRLVVVDLTAAGLDRALSVQVPADLLLFNVGAPDRRFRDKDCRPYLLHTLPSRDMLTDALAQYLVKKRWRDWFLVVGPLPEDALYAAALRRSARKFGAEIVEEKAWTGEHDARRTAQAEVPLFTQGIDYDVLMVADEIGDFGDYLMFRTWLPRLVAGTQGLVAAAWGRPVEQWGATQLQERFLAKTGRWMTPRDYAAWAAVRAVGEAATRTASNDPAKIGGFIRSDDFQLAAFKGRKLSFRAWNGQLRQPLPLITGRSQVSQSPQEGFLHQRTELDSLGLDAPESACGK